ncbi:60S ribosome subunit biogenesis protein NIP7 [Tetrabaena socialis]|uniref:60S ribosome subunit biogenesis protein NIP7 homolog n=1 Tax=Tetrabaena socialis TaxID=47790 RepID=A0A2J8AJP4_9CHLO|nr:60S ribosome subunit biogenesis protein NIP7 [Tetrabaena socialis]|eukprot:PNH12746.1 60S ribosome subunit biogenesis protein NIP7 [Tetrabaena socialis]
MRPLTEEETKAVFEKLYKFIGKNIKNLIDRPNEPYCFRLHKNKVFYVKERLMKKATNVSRDKLVALGTCVGKLTHTGKFRLTIGALDLISQYAKHKIWVKPSAEMQFLYGNNILKSGLARITENTPTYTGVVIYSMADIPLGFGVTAKSTNECRSLDPNAVVAFHQADCGEFLRNEDEL